MVLDDLARKFDTQATGTDAEWRICCPFCKKLGHGEDTKFHVYVNTQKKVFLCHRCGSKGSITRLIGKSSDEQQITSDWYQKFVDPPDAHEEEVVGVQPIPVKFPTGAVDINPGSLAERYLLSRGISQYAIYRYGIKDWPKRQRVIVPTYRNGVAEFYVARTYINETPKYLNPFYKTEGGSMRRNCVFGYDQSQHSSQIVICEGVFSALAVGINAIATFGKLVTRNQIDLICSMGADEYVVAFDADANQEAWSVAKILQDKVTASVRVVNWQGQSEDADPDSVGRDVMENLLDKADTYSWLSVVSNLMA